MGLALLVVIAVIAFWVVAAYNSLISLKNQVANAWKQIDVQLKRRHDLIPNLINTVKGAMQFERDTLQAVVEARNKAVAVSAGGGPAGTSVAATAAAESQLTGALGRLFAVVEAYPDLKSTGNVAQLQEELTSTENKIAFARQLYNDTATGYNTRQRQFPTVLVAGLVGAAPAELWEITDGAERDNVNVDLSMGAPRPALGAAPPVLPSIAAPGADAATTAPVKPAT
jgi:LemA protein